MTVCVELPPTRSSSPAPPSVRWRREIWWFLGPLALCPVVALVQPGDAASALARARQLLDWERSVGLAVEPTVHAWVVARPVVHHAAEVFYFAAHVSALVATALWLAARRPDAYVRFRATFAVAQVLTIAVYLLVPVAPLRMVLDGSSATGGAGWTRSVQYELAAMPSGHVVFALVIGTAVWQHAPRRWAWLGIAHPGLTVAVVVATAHHLVVDAVVAAAVGLTAHVATRPVDRRRARPRVPAAP